MKKKKAKPLYPNQGLRKKIKRVRDANLVGPTEVATILGETYQHARNLMLRGTFGKPQYDEENRSLTVQRDAVLAYTQGGPRRPNSPK